MCICCGIQLTRSEAVYLLVEMESQWVALSIFVSIAVLIFFSQSGLHVFIGTDPTGSLDVQRMLDTAHKQCQRLIEQYQDIINAKEDSCLSSLERARTDDWACAKSFNRSMQFQDASCRLAMKSWESLHRLRNRTELDPVIDCDSKCKKELGECMKISQAQLLWCNKTVRVLHLQREGQEFRKVVVIRNLHLQLNRTRPEYTSVQEGLERCFRQNWTSMSLTAYALVVFTLVVFTAVVSISLLWKYWKNFVATTPSGQPPVEVVGAQAPVRVVKTQHLTDSTAMEQRISELEQLCLQEKAEKAAMERCISELEQLCLQEMAAMEQSVSELEQVYLQEKEERQNEMEAKVALLEGRIASLELSHTHERKQLESELLEMRSKLLDERDEAE